MKNTFEFAQEILNREDIDNVLEFVINAYSKRKGKSMYLVNMISNAMSNTINEKNNELRRWEKCIEVMPKKSKLSDTDKNIYTVLSYCSTYLNFPKFYADSILDPIHKRFIGIDYFKNEKFSIEMWNAFKEIVIPRFNQDMQDDECMNWWKEYGNDDTHYNYTKWCIENMEMIEKSTN